MMAQEVMMPIGMQAPVPRRKVPGPSKKEAARFPTKTAMVAGSMQIKRSLIPWKSIDSLPSISGLLIEAIASCKSDSGISFAELKEMLGAKGYDMRRHCPRIKRKLQSLVSKGALVRMTCGKGSTFFVVRKYQGKATKISGDLEAAVRIKKAGMCASAKTKGAAAEATSSRWKAGETNRKLKRSKQKRKATQKQSGQSISRSRSAERAPDLCPRPLSAAKKSSSTGSKTSTSQEPPHSSQGSVSALRRSSRNRKSRAASFFKTAQSALAERAPKRHGPSKKGLPPPVKEQLSPYYKGNLLAKHKGYCRGVKTYSAKRRRSRRRSRAAFHPPRRTSSNSERVLRR